MTLALIKMQEEIKTSQFLLVVVYPLWAVGVTGPLWKWVLLILYPLWAVGISGPLWAVGSGRY